MKTKLIGVAAGIVFGFTLAWARLTDPHIIRNMLLLKEAHVFLIMGSAVVIAAIGVRLLKASGARTIFTDEPIAWSVERPQTRHIVGSVLFGFGWATAGTCPGPVAAMIGQGRLAGLAVAVGLVAGVALQRLFVGRSVEQSTPARAAAGL